MAFGIPVAHKIEQIHYWDDHGEEVSFYLKSLQYNDLLLKQVLLMDCQGAFCSQPQDDANQCGDNQKEEAAYP